MYIAPINSVHFKGTTRFLSCNSEGKAKTISDYPFGTAFFGETRGLSEFVKKHSFPFADVEEVIGKIHDNKTYKVYVSDPYEKVSDLIKQNHDYIVYDKEPEFPDIQRNYFDADTNIINKAFKTVQDYLLRLEAAGVVSAKELKNKKRMVETCSEIYQDGVDLLNQKYSIEEKIKINKNLINEIVSTVPLYVKELEWTRIRLSGREKFLEAQEMMLAEYKTNKALLKKKVRKTVEEAEKNNFNIEKCEQTISHIKKRMQIYKNKIDNLVQYIEQSPSKIKQCENKISKYEKRLAEINAALMPKFKKLCDFYTKNGIRMVKNL